MEKEFSLDAIREIASELWKHGKEYKVWAVNGQMGAGKTTVIHALGNTLGVTAAMGSPTYAIINEYQSSSAGIIYHMDWYRLKDEEEAIQAGVEEALYSGNLCLVEWSERAIRLLPEKIFNVHLEVLSPTMRRISTL